MSAPRVTAVKGMNDLLPEESPLWQKVEAAARRVSALYGFSEIRTPVVESTSLFVRGIGGETDVVGKEMYTFEDRGGESLSLRPEGTAGAVRAYVEHSRHAVDPIQKWFYLGPMFRGEAPQKGRYRQFHQFGAELFGVEGPRADVELIALVVRFVKELGLGNLSLRLNSLGDEESRPAYRDALVRHFSPHAAKLSETDRRRLEKNPLRLLDSKDETVQQLAKDAPSTLDHLSPGSKAHFDEVLRGLDALGIRYEVDPRIVRGLDYYTRTTFELVATRGLGSQSTLAGGGRYDRLVEELGGPPTPAIGFALGLERLMLLLGESALVPQKPRLFLGVLGDQAGVEAEKLAEAARDRGLAVEVTLKGAGVAKQMKRADRLGATFSAIIGDGELSSGKVRLKRLATGEEKEIGLASVVDEIAADARAEDGT